MAIDFLVASRVKKSLRIEMVEIESDWNVIYDFPIVQIRFVSVNVDTKLNVDSSLVNRSGISGRHICNQL